jgi:L-fuculose-phosphate aldolase
MLFDFFEAARYVGRKNLVSGSSGNLSHLWREKASLWISASGSWLEALSFDDLVECSFPDGAVSRSEQGKKPSSELHMHLEILKKRPDVNTVLHFQAPYATVISASSPIAYEQNLDTIPEVPYYLGKVGIIDYVLPGSDELASMVAQEIESHDALILQNHGQLVVGVSLEEVIQKALFLEFACMTVALGKETERLTQTDIAALQKYKTQKG